MVAEQKARAADWGPDVELSLDVPGDLPPVAPAADYPALYPVADARVARRLAVRLEEDAAAAWRFLYAVVAETGTSPPGLRASAQAALIASAVRATRWRLAAQSPSPTVAFPGI